MKIMSLPAFMSLLAGFTLAACSPGKTKHTQPASTKVTVREVGAHSATQELSYSGNIEPDNTAQIGFAVPGVINNIYVQEGQQVQQGQLLATIDATEYDNALAIANAGLEQAEDMFGRLDGLYKKGSLPEKDYIDIKTKLAQARANRSINRKRINDSKLHAPISGIVSSKAIERGSTAAPGIVAFTIIKTDQVYARISVPESEVGALRSGMEVSVLVPTLQESFTGKITIINPQADAVSRTYSVKVLLGNPGGKLLPGMITETKINTGKTTAAIAIPAPAIIRDADGLTYVYVANTHKKAIRTRVTTGSMTGNNEVIITDGLAPGALVIVAGQTRLKDGAPVNF